MVEVIKSRDHIHYQLQFPYSETKTFEAPFSVFRSFFLLFGFLFRSSKCRSFFVSTSGMGYFFIFIFCYRLRNILFIHTITTGSLLLVNGKCQRYTCALKTALWVLLARPVEEQISFIEPTNSNSQGDSGGTC